MSRALLLSTGLILLSPFAAFADGKHPTSDAKPWSQADDIWGEEAMAKSRSMVLSHNGAQRFWMFSADRLELQSSDEEDMFVFDGDIWYGGDLNKLWIKTEGEYGFDEEEFEEADIQLLWSRAVSPFWDFQTGLRYDFAPRGETYAVAGFQGTAPYQIETDAALFLSSNGDLTGALEAEYEFMLTQRLELSPRLELGWSAQEIESRETGEGFTDAAIGLRLSYDIEREFSPYIGVEWQGALGETRDMIEAEGEDADATVFVIGIRAWY